MKIPNGYYDSPASLGKYLETEFGSNSPNKGDDELTACQIHRWYDIVTQKISLSDKTIGESRMITLKERFIAHIGAVCTPSENKIFITDTNTFGVRRAFLYKHTIMYIYCDAVKYTIIGDTQAPLLATLLIQGTPNEQCFWGFNPPYYISVNQKALSSFEIRICTDTGDLFPFDHSGRVVVQLHFRRQRSLL